MARTCRAEALRKQIDAIELRTAGKSYGDIAAALGYANRSAAWKAVDRGLRAERDLMAGEHLQLAVDRLEALLRTRWDDAVGGQNTAAFNGVLRVLAQMDRLLGLTAHGQRRDKRESGERLGVVMTPKRGASGKRQASRNAGHLRHDRAGCGRWRWSRWLRLLVVLNIAPDAGDRVDEVWAQVLTVVIAYYARSEPPFRLGLDHCSVVD